MGLRGLMVGLSVGGGVEGLVVRWRVGGGVEVVGW